MGGLFDKTAQRAGRQQGRINCEQLLELGVERWRIESWVADGRLRRVHRGVYAVGHEAPSVLGDYMAAVLACGSGAGLSHRAEAHVMHLLAGKAPPPEVTVPTLSGRGRKGIVIHRVKELRRLGVCTVHGIPMTTVPRTLLDLAAMLDLPTLTRACHEAWIRHRTTPRSVEDCIARNPGKKGIAKLRTALGSDVTLSKLEDRFLALLREHGLPGRARTSTAAATRSTATGRRSGSPSSCVSYRFHASRRAFESDVARRRRSNHLAFTWGDVFERPQQTIAELVAAMTSATPVGSDPP